MAEIFLNNIYISLLLPFWIFLIIMLGRFFAVYVNKFIIYTLTLLSSAFGILLTAGALLKLPVDKILETSYPFIKINDLIIDCGLHVDKTALIFSFVLFTVSFLVQLFSISYMKNEKKAYKFYALMNLFNFSMVGLFFSPNLFQTYFFWELAGIVSYLLIAFEYNKEIKSKASKKVFLINRIGDTAFIGAIILSSYFMYSYAPNKALAMLSFTDMNVISTLVYAYASNPLFEIICGMFVIALVVKSAQFPFYTWLQDAMEAKLPVSALLHSATLVAAGVFLTLRLLPFYTLEPILLKGIAIIGVLTALMCSLSACAQTNPKKVLAYSTSAQLGLVFLAIGVLNIRAALALFVAHAFIKPLLFITLPDKEEKWNYLKFVVFLLCGLSLSGLILSGMVAKEMVIYGFALKGTVIVSVLSFLTAFYIIRIALVVFDEKGLEKTKPEILQLLAFIGLIILNLGLYVFLHKTSQYQVAESFWAALTAWVCVYILYVKNAFWKVPILYPITLNGFYIDRFYLLLSEKLYGGFAKLCDKIDLNILSNYKPILFFAKLGVNVSAFVEDKIMNGTINLVTKTFRKISLLDSRGQNGSIQNYNAYAFIIITVVITCLIFGYIAMLIYIGG